MLGAMKREARRAEYFVAKFATLAVGGAYGRAAITAERDAFLRTKQAVLVVHAAHLHNPAIEIVTHGRAVLYHRELGFGIRRIVRASALA